MQYHGIVDINFADSTLSVFPYDARMRDTGSTELADLLDNVTPALLARGVPMRQVRLGGGLGVCGHICACVLCPGPAHPCVRLNTYNNRHQIDQLFIGPHVGHLLCGHQSGWPLGRPCPRHRRPRRRYVLCFYLYQVPFPTILYTHGTRRFHTMLPQA